VRREKGEGGEARKTMNNAWQRLGRSRPRGMSRPGVLPPDTVHHPRAGRLLRGAPCKPPFIRTCVGRGAKGYWIKNVLAG
jgi:hypothetical protein